MFAARKTDGAVTTAASYIEDVFSTYLYTGNGSVQTIPNGIALGSAYGGSVYFDGSGDYLTAASNAAFNFGTGDFTIEFWFYPTNVTTTQIIYDQRFSGSIQVTPCIYLNSSIVRYYVSGADRITSGSSFSNNQWYHIAVSRNGTSTRMFVNGTQVGSTYTDNNNYITSPVRVGAYGVDGTLAAEGYFSNVRLVKGTAVYTSSFTPSTTPLTAVTDTQLLICQSPSPTTDYSSNAFTITVTNAVAQNGGGPFTDSTANKGGMVWLKGRSGATDHALYDTNRGATFDLGSNLSTAQTTQTTGLTSFNGNGFSIGSLAKLNTSAATYASWTFREQAKFFDVVTYTGNGSNRTIAHNLGSVPGCIIIKRTDTAADWQVYHRSLANTEYLVLNSTAAKATGTTRWNSTTPTSTEFSLGTDSTVNANSGTYVAYLFAHDAGGFGASGTDNVISCGSYTGNGSATGPTVTLGYEPQFILTKRASGGTGNWATFDNMRGIPTGSADAVLYPNVNDAEVSANAINVSATGFQIASSSTFINNSGDTYIYIAIRRGPMRPPSSGTSVFTPIKTGSGSTLSDSYESIGFPIDMTLRYQTGTNTGATYKNVVFTRLLGINSGASDIPTSTNASKLLTPATDAASTSAIYYSQTGSMELNYGGSWNAPDYVLTHLHFRRAPGFFDVVCYAGTGANRTVTHNLGVAPELMIVKCRSAAATNWVVYSSTLTATKALYLNTTNAELTGGYGTIFFNDTEPTDTVFSLGTDSFVNNSARTYVAYLFATVAGVSKVGSYTGNGSSQTINCGFTAGARFILIKRTDSTGDWYVWDTARGIVSGNDPHLSLNSTAAEVTTDDSTDPDNSGFIVNQLSATNINVNAATYIYLAIA